MKKLILSLLLVLAIVVPVTAQAFTFEENCREAIYFGWRCDSCNATCLFRLMADILGPGPDGAW
jgi:hypothetical protein